LQELFGTKENPKLLFGTTPLQFHLLGPNYRPVQVTSDIASFWKNTYPEVRKELRARYPKHSWPDDPTTAPAVKKGRSQKN
jgi:ATP-dependent helicase HrpB